MNKYYQWIEVDVNKWHSDKTFIGMPITKPLCVNADFYADFYLSYLLNSPRKTHSFFLSDTYKDSHLVNCEMC